MIGGIGLGVAEPVITIPKGTMNKPGVKCAPARCAVRRIEVWVRRARKMAERHVVPCGEVNTQHGRIFIS